MFYNSNYYYYCNSQPCTPTQLTTYEQYFPIPSPKAYRCCCFYFFSSKVKTNVLSNSVFQVKEWTPELNEILLVIRTPGGGIGGGSSAEYLPPSSTNCRYTLCLVVEDGGNYKSRANLSHGQ